MIEVKQYHRYRAKVSYKRTNDLQPGSPQDGSEVLVNAAWTIDDGEFKGQWAFFVDGLNFWMPHCDLTLLETIEEMTQ